MHILEANTFLMVELMAAALISASLTRTITLNQLYIFLATRDMYPNLDLLYEQVKFNVRNGWLTFHCSLQAVKDSDCFRLAA